MNERRITNHILIFLVSLAGNIQLISSNVNSSLLECLHDRPAYAQISTQINENNELECKCSAGFLSDPTKRDDYDYYPEVGSAYKFHNYKRTWNVARKICQGEGGDLVVIDSYAEYKIIEKMMVDRYAGRKCFLLGCLIWVKQAFIGIHDLFETGEWVTVKGDPVKYTHWRRGQPDWSGEHCGSVIQTGEMNNVYCHDPWRFICEIPSIC